MINLEKLKFLFDKIWNHRTQYYLAFKQNHFHFSWFDKKIPRSRADSGIAFVFIFVFVIVKKREKARIYGTIHAFCYKTQSLDPFQISLSFLYKFSLGFLLIFTQFCNDLHHAHDNVFNSKRICKWGSQNHSFAFEQGVRDHHHFHLIQLV